MLLKQESSCKCHLRTLREGYTLSTTPPKPNSLSKRHKSELRLRWKQPQNFRFEPQPSANISMPWIEERNCNPTNLKQIAISSIGLDGHKMV